MDGGAGYERARDRVADGPVMAMVKARIDPALRVKDASRYK